MPLTRVGVLSGNEVSTYQSNTANVTELEFTKENFRKLLQEFLLLEREAYQLKVESNRQKKEIIDLYTRINVDRSPIMVAV